MAEIITTPFIERCSELLVNCAATGSIGVINGGNGCGKSWALRAMQRRFSKVLPGECILYRCCQARGYTRGIRDFLIEQGVGGAILRNNSNASFQLIIKLAQRELDAQNIKGILLDEADLWNHESLGGLITLFDTCQDKGTGFVLILAGAKPVNQWMANVPAAASRTLKVEMAPLLDEETTLAVLAHWHPLFAGLRDEINSGSKPSIAAMKVLHKATRGNLRKLSFFAPLFANAGYTAVTTAAIRETLQKMTLQGDQ